MPLITASLAITAIWAGLELVGGVMAEEIVKSATKPVTKKIALWIKQKSGWEDKHREKVFRDAYVSAEETLIKQIGIDEAYRIFSIVNRMAGEVGIREALVLAIFERDDALRTRIISDPFLKGMHQGLTDVWPKFGLQHSEDFENLDRFTRHLRTALYATDIYRPVIEIYELEDAKIVREHMLTELSKLSRTIDPLLNAIQVKIVEAADYQQERQIYLKQMQAYFEEQDFIGFPESGDRRSPLLLKDIYIPLQVRYDGGGEKMADEIGKLIVSGRGEN